jgi:hypothetical protein
MDEIKELRNAAEGCGVAFMQGSQQFSSVQFFKKDHASAHKKRKKQVGHLCQSVEERKHTENAIVLIHMQHLEGCFSLRKDIAMREDHAFGIAGRPRGVQDDGRILRPGSAGWQWCRTLARKLFQTRDAWRPAVKKNKIGHTGADAQCLFCNGEVSWCREKHFGAAVM